MQKDNFFNIDDASMGIQRGLAEGLAARVFPGAQAMISVVTIEPGHRGKVHCHPEEQWGLLIRGSGVRTQGGEEIPVKQGDFWCTPGHVEHTFQAGPDGATVFDIFAPPREDYKKSGSGFGDAKQD